MKGYIVMNQSLRWTMRLFFEDSGHSDFPKAGLLLMSNHHGATLFPTYGRAKAAILRTERWGKGRNDPPWAQRNNMEIILVTDKA